MYHSIVLPFFLQYLTNAKCLHQLFIFYVKIYAVDPHYFCLHVELTFREERITNSMEQSPSCLQNTGYTFVCSWYEWYSSVITMVSFSTLFYRRRRRRHHHHHFLPLLWTSECNTSPPVGSILLDFDQYWQFTTFQWQFQPQKL